MTTQSDLAAWLARAGGVGFAKPEAGLPFYFHALRSVGAGLDPDAVLIEMTFNPEIVSISGISTDLLVYWNSEGAVAHWLEETFIGTTIELCPPELEDEATRKLFSLGSRDVEANARMPWNLEQL